MLFESTGAIVDLRSAKVIVSGWIARDGCLRDRSSRGGNSVLCVQCGKWIVST